MNYFRCCGDSGTDTSDATATADNILRGKTAYVNGNKITGTMTNNGARTASLNCGGSYTIPKGYHNGSGKVTANSASSQGLYSTTIDGIKQTKNISLSSAAGNWTSVSTLPYEFYYGSAVVCNGVIHILVRNSNYMYHYIYNNGSWTHKTSLVCNSNYLSAVAVNNIIYMAYSYNSRFFLYRYDGSSWSNISTVDNSSLYAKLLYCNNTLYTFSYDKLYAYNFSTSAWTSVSTLPFENCYLMTVLNDEIHILGSNSTYYTDAHYKFNGSTWTSVSTLPYPVAEGQAVVLNNSIHILGGTNGEKNHYRYNGSAWTSVSTLPYEFYYGSAVVLDDEIHILGSINDIYSKRHYKLPFLYKKI